MSTETDEKSSKPKPLNKSPRKRQSRTISPKPSRKIRSENGEKTLEFVERKNTDIEGLEGRPHNYLVKGMSLDVIPTETTNCSDPVDAVENLVLEKKRLERRVAEIQSIFDNLMRAEQKMTPISEEESTTKLSIAVHPAPRKLTIDTNSLAMMKDTLVSSESPTSPSTPMKFKQQHPDYSFNVPGLTSEEVIKEVEKSRSHHARSLDEANEKIVCLIRKPALLEEPHEETFYELFYDLILAVVFIKLSYLKYDLSPLGVLSVFALFANFWSCWSLLNCYVTMLHTEDVLHRIYYISHITASFVMAISIENPEFQFFNYRYMSWYHAGASILCRVITLFMWAYAYTNDFVKTHHTQHHHSVHDYEKKDVKRQISVHFLTLLASILVFLLTMYFPFEYDGSSAGHHYPTALLWILAVVIEQLGTSMASVLMKLPFSATYAGERMQAWLMLCFGESVIALLIEPIFYDSAQVGSICAAFIMILCLCTAYFDIVDADEFLNLLCLRGERYKAILYMNFQCIFSFSVFLCGVSLKTIIYVSNTLYLYEIVTGCSLGHHHEAAHRKLSLLDHLNIFNKKNQIIEPFFDYQAELDQRMLSAGTADDIHYTIKELDHLMRKSFFLLCFSTTTVMMFSIFIGYCMPIGLPPFQVHSSRIGAVVVSLFTLVVPFTLKTLVTRCFMDFENDDDDNRYPRSPQGISIMKGLIIISMIILGAFFVALGSLDPNREATYAKLEEEAHFKRTKHHLEKRYSQSSTTKALTRLNSDSTINTQNTNNTCNTAISATLVPMEASRIDFHPSSSSSLDMKTTTSKPATIDDHACMVQS